MGQILFNKGKVILYGPPLYTLPEDLSLEFVRALLAARPGDESFIGELARSFTPEEKTRLRVACHGFKGPVWREYCRLAARWAPIVNQDNQWHLDDFTPVYEAEVNSWWAHTVIITDSNIRFVTTPRGVFTFTEFENTYGQDVVSHIEAYRKERATELSAVIRHITSQLIRRKVTLADDEGRMISDEIVVLESLQTDLWRLPKGMRLMSIDD